MYKKIGPLSLALSFLILSLPVLEVGPLYAEVDRYGNLSAHDVMSNLNWTNVVEHARILSSYESRITGYPGYYESVNYVAKVLDSLGLTPEFQGFEVSVPLSSGATVSIVDSGETLEAFPLQPNFVALSSTQPEGIRGPLVYVGKGGSDFDGKSVDGSIVLMRMDSKDEWVSAASLGAKAVIFLAEEPVTREEAEYKRLNVPFNFPRVYVEGHAAKRLQELAQSGDEEVVLRSAVRWEEVAAKNVFVTIPGEIGETIVLAVHLDTWSVVPDRAPGAREAMNTALLLELARIYRNISPRRALLIAFLSGYHQNLAGAREFVEDSFEKVSEEIRLFVGIDLGTYGDRVALAYAGWTYNYYLAAGGSAGGLTATNRLYDLYNTFEQQIIPRMGELGKNVDNGLTDSPVHSVWEAFMPIPLGFDHEAYNQAGGTGFTIITSRDRRDHWKTPDDTLGRINQTELKGQVETTLSLIDNIVSIEEIPLHPESVRTRYSTTIGAAGFATLTGTVVRYDFRTAWYKVLNKAVLAEEYGPDASVFVHIYLSYPARTFPLLFDALVKPDENGSFTVYGVPTVNTWWSTTRFTSEAAALTASNLVVEPYVVDEYGHVLAAPDFGRYGSPQRLYQIDKALFKVDRATVFDCGSVVLFDLLEFQYIDVLKREIVNEPSLAPPTGNMVHVFDASGHVPTDFQFASAASTSDVLVLYVSPDTNFEAVGTSSRYAYPNIVLSRRGSGYGLNRGEQLILYNSLLEAVQNLAFTVEQRLDVTSSFNVHSLLAEPLHAQAEEYLNEARNFYENKDYGMFKSMAKTAWNHEYLAYIYSRQLYEDVINTITFFSTLLVPAALLLSTLLFGSLSTLKRILANVGTFSILVTILFFFHPGFHLASSTMMVLAGFVSVLLLVPVQSILIGLFGDQLKQFRQRVMGLHFAEISRISAAMIAFSMGIENMRKRKLRTLLTCVSLSVMVFSLTALTSLPSLFSHMTIPVRDDSPYTGIMLRRDDWQDLSPDFVQTLSKRFDGTAIASPRVWLYPRFARRGVTVSGEIDVNSTGFALVSGSQRYFVDAILGVTAEDPLLEKYSAAFLTEDSRWLIPQEDSAQVCLLGRSFMRKLGVMVGDKIRMEGLDFQIIGFYDESVVNQIEDLDGRKTMPIDRSKPGQVSMDSGSVIIIPYEASLKLGGSPTLVIMGFGNSTSVEDYAKGLSLEFSLNPYYGSTGRDVKQISVYTTISTYGFQNVLVLLAISVFTIFNMMLGVIEERTREISTLAVVGLSPLHISFMFLAEITEYAVIGAVFGYVAGIVGISLIQTLRIGPDIVLNYSSNLVTISLGISISSTLAASLIPARRASRIATPSLVRKWKIPTKPVGTEWTIPLPFSSTPDELPGILIFLEEHISSQSEEGIGSFISSGTGIGKITYREEKCPAVESRIQLQPYDQGVTQEVHVIALPEKSGEKYDFIVYTKRLTGIEGTWKRSNPLFVDDMRKQLLIWRTLREGERKEYIEKGKEWVNRNG